jgi:hypothetical protein
VPIVTGDAALDHFVAPLVARHDECGQVAEAKAKRGERRHDDELQLFTHCTISGSLAIFAAIRRASSRGSSDVGDHSKSDLEVVLSFSHRGGDLLANHCNGQFRADGK